MYKVYLDDNLLYHSNMTEEFPLAEAKVDQEINKAGTFVFTIYENNPMYNRIQKMKSIIKIYDDNCRLFRGRVLNATRGMYNELHVTCEGELAFLVDTRVRPYSFEGTVEEYFAFLVTSHNAQVEPEKQFTVGICTVAETNDYIVEANEDYPNTFEELNDKLLNTLGGYLWVREEDDGVYIDYLADFETVNNQKVEFGENLLDFEETIKGQDIATAVIPLGCKLKDEDGNETGERLTIAVINDGVDYVFHQEAVEKYGYIFKVVEFEDVIFPEDLKAKGEEELADTIHLTQTIELSAVDLHALNLEIENFCIGKYTFVESKPHNFSDQFLTRKISINLLNPSDSTLSLGDERQTFVDKQVDKNKAVNSYIGKVETEYKKTVNERIQFLDSLTTSRIEQSADEIILEIGSTYYTKGDVENIVRELESTIAQTAADVKIEISDLNKDLQDKFNLVTKYFTFNVNGITIGQVDNPYKVIIDNDRYSMTVNEIEVLWIDAVTGEVHTPEITITRKMIKMGYVEEMDEEKRLNCIWAGDE